jgi:hypothetical protein
MINEKKLYSIVYQVPESFEEKKQKLIDLQNVLRANSLMEELISIYEGVSNRDRTIFVRYTLHNVTYQALGEKFNISKERIRQIYNRTAEIICDHLRNRSTVYLQSACLIADKMGDELSEEKLRKVLIQQGMIDLQKRNDLQDTFELMLALIVNPKTSILIEMSELETE